MDLHEHISRKEIINLRESSVSNWRVDLLEGDEGDHPYVDIMPCADEAQQMKKDAVKSKKKKEKEEKEEVKEGKDPNSGSDFAKQEGEIAMREHERTHGRKTLDLSKHKKKKK